MGQPPGQPSPVQGGGSSLQPGAPAGEVRRAGQPNCSKTLRGFSSGLPQAQAGPGTTLTFESLTFEFLAQQGSGAPVAE